MTLKARTIEQILQIRVRAAEIRVVERAAAAVKAAQAVEMAIDKTPAEQTLADLVHALDVAREASELAHREVASQHGLPVEHVLYEAASGQTLDRYAGVLMLDDPTLLPVDAWLAAHTDERIRSADYMARFHPDTDDGLDEDVDEV